jgi:high-affinity iron transporter
MIFWMARESRKLGGSLRSKIDAAVQGSIWSLSFVAFFAVIREGIETSVLLWSATKSVGNDGSPAWGAFLGLATATVLGYLLYRGSLKVNLGIFFKYTGAYLIVVAAGILSYGIHELQEIGWINLLPQKAYDLSVAIPDGSVLHAVLKGVIAFDTAPTLLQALAWFAYLIPVAVIYWRASFRKVAK